MTRNIIRHLKLEINLIIIQLYKICIIVHIKTRGNSLHVNIPPFTAISKLVASRQLPTEYRITFYQVTCHLFKSYRNPIFRHSAKTSLKPVDENSMSNSGRRIFILSWAHFRAYVTSIFTSITLKWAVIQGCKYQNN